MSRCVGYAYKRQCKNAPTPGRMQCPDCRAALERLVVHLKKHPITGKQSLKAAQDAARGIARENK